MFFDSINQLHFPLINSSEIIWGQNIGNGSSGEVYECFHKNNKYIAKCFNKQNFYSFKEYQNYILSELYIYSKLKECKYISQIYSISNNNNKEAYILMYHHNTTDNIYDFISKNIYWENQSYIMNKTMKIKITLSMCLALQELHTRKIIHCDIKLKNMLYLENEDKVILVDFGASTALNNNKKYTYIDESMGTTGYMSNELNYGIAYLKSDIYSLAVSILEIWCGEIWTMDYGTHKECRKDILKSLTFLEKKEPRLTKVLRSCLVNDVNKRPYIHTLIQKLKSSIEI